MPLLIPSLNTRFNASVTTPCCSFSVKSMPGWATNYPSAASHLIYLTFLCYIWAWLWKCDWLCKIERRIKMLSYSNKRCQGGHQEKDQDQEEWKVFVICDMGGLNMNFPVSVSCLKKWWQLPQTQRLEWHSYNQHNMTLKILTKALCVFQCIWISVWIPELVLYMHLSVSIHVQSYRGS